MLAACCCSARVPDKIARIAHALASVLASRWLQPWMPHTWPVVSFAWVRTSSWASRTKQHETAQTPQRTTCPGLPGSFHHSTSSPAAVTRLCGATDRGTHHVRPAVESQDIVPTTWQHGTLLATQRCETAATPLRWLQRLLLLSFHASIRKTVNRTSCRASCSHNASMHSALTL